ncbi:AraC-like ligand binding domain-containing protein [Noviherbaspirillum humi]|uniref:AraC-like ligand binding domain-containing protein n=1 Tax=Noviherbaspirillum humi TaxID=1688639 RepID=A0A239KM02_9BURK|nr:AraC family ligand binding domain-containing protein [Noviherbaspirillum humi]SNT18752.1 AraC-like ligand binding domain-containing protein [Noviherbaspirillum humi]
MNKIDFKTFEREALASGHDEALERRWEPNSQQGTHSHPFDAEAVVVQGEMWLTCKGTTRHLLPGDTFTLERGELHEERYGPVGATYWVARRNAVKREQGASTPDEKSVL